MLQLKNIRKEAGIKQKDVAAHMQVSQGNVSDWESGRAQPSIEAIIELARYLNVSTDDLLGYYNMNNPSNSLSNEEIDIINYLRQLSRDERNQVKGFVKALAGQKTKER